MALELTPRNVVLLVAAVVSALVAALAWRRREEDTALALVAVMVAAEGWIVGAIVADLQPARGFQIFWGKVNFLFIPLTAATWLVFALLYAGREDRVTTGTLATLGAYVVAVAVIVWTNDPGGFHDLFWPEITINAETAAADEWAHGGLWWVNAFVMWGMIIGGTGMILREVINRDSVYRAQGYTMAVGVVVPLVLNFAYLGPGPVDVDLTPAGFAVTGVALLWGMTSYGLGDVAPVARRTLLANFRDGLIVVDTDDRIIEINDEAKRMFGLDPDREFIGDPMREVFDHMPGFYETYGGLEEAREDVDVDLKEQRTFDVQVSPLQDSRDELVGRMFLVHDITEQKRRERELELQNRQLDQFASLVTHEIQDPLADVSERLEAVLDRVNTEDRGQLLHAQRSLDEIDELVDDMLAMARQGSVVDREETKVVNLRDAADRAWWDLTEDRMPQRVTVADQDVRADPDRLDRMLMNLFENAIKYAGADATIRVDVLEGADGKVGFYVEDDGPGIPKSARESVFQAGVSGSDSSAGLGLAIVRTMAEAHDWEVSVTDGDLGGARFAVTGVEFPEQRVREVDASFEPAATDD